MSTVHCQVWCLNIFIYLGEYDNDENKMFDLFNFDHIIESIF